MKSFAQITLLLLIFFGRNFSTHGQVFIDTIYFDASGKDARTYQGATTTNYGSDTLGKVYYDYGPPNYSSWTYYQIDLTSIPINAVVTKSSLNLYALSVTNGSAHPFLADRVTSSWAENTITWASPPSALASGVGRITMPISASSNSGWQSLEITAHAQYSVANPSLNYGWRIAMSATGSADYGSIHASSEYANSALRPYMIVEYRIPLTDTIYLDTNGFDAHVYSGSTATNYGTDSSLQVKWDTISTGYANRSFVRVDLSSIPRDVIVTNANLYMYAEAVDNSTSHAIYVSGVSANWTEGGITWANQPVVTNANRSSNTHAATSSTGWHVTGIKNLAQVAVTSPEKNYGWRVSLQVETDTLTKGITYASTEDGDSSHRPYVIVEYQMPIEVSGYVTHCTNGNNDGAITGVSVTGGCYSYTSYGLYLLSGGVLTAIETGSNIANADVTGLANGLYLMRVNDYKGVIGYRYFFVGEEGVTTNVEFAITHAGNRGAFSEDNWLTYYKATGDSSTVNATATSVACYSSTTYNSRTLIQHYVDWDPSLEFTRADQTFLNKGGSYQSATSDNDAWLSRVNEPWEERWVNWTLRPSVSAVDRVYIPTTTTNGTEARNDTVDILPLVTYWQTNVDENFGFELALATYNQPAAAYRDYGSNDYTGHNLIVSFTVIPANTKYWVGTVSSDWSDPLNWSDTSGGPGGAGVPNLKSTVVFDENGNINCYSNTTKIVFAVQIQSGYTANIDFNSGELISNEISTQNE